MELLASELSKASGVYAIENIETGAVYIGQSKNILSRWHQHAYELSVGNHHSAGLQADWREYGADVFRLAVIEYTDEPTEREAHWIAEYTQAGRQLYNGAMPTHPVSANNMESQLEGLRYRIAGTVTKQDANEFNRLWRNEVIPLVVRDPLQDVVTAVEAAQMLGCSRYAVLRMAKAGQVRARQSGSTWLILKADLPCHDNPL